jgi:hypothetical protein
VSAAAAAEEEEEEIQVLCLEERCVLHSSFYLTVS